MALNLELIETRAPGDKAKGVLVTNCRINGEPVSLVGDQPIDLQIAKEEFATVTLTMFIDTLTVTSEETA